MAQLTVSDIFQPVSTSLMLSAILTEINDLAFLQNSDEFGLLRPSYRALTVCIKTVLTLAADGELVPPYDIGTDRNGDIRIAWSNEDREAELVFPSDEKTDPYLYYSSPDSYGTEVDPIPQAISKRVQWALGREKVDAR